MTKEIKSEGWTGRGSGGPDNDSAKTRFSKRAVATFVAGFATARVFGELEVGLLGLLVVLLFCAHGLWRHHVGGARHPRVSEFWVLAAFTAASIPLLLWIATHPSLLGFKAVP